MECRVTVLTAFAVFSQGSQQLIFSSLLLRRLCLVLFFFLAVVRLTRGATTPAVPTSLCVTIEAVKQLSVCLYLSVVCDDALHLHCGSLRYVI